MTGFAAPPDINVTGVELFPVVFLRKAEFRQREPTLPGVFAGVNLINLPDSVVAENVGLQEVLGNDE